MFPRRVKGRATTKGQPGQTSPRYTRGPAPNVAVPLPSRQSLSGVVSWLHAGAGVNAHRPPRVYSVRGTVFHLTLLALPDPAASPEARQSVSHPTSGASPRLLAVSAAAIVAVYGAGYQRTLAAAASHAERSAPSRRPAAGRDTRVTTATTATTATTSQGSTTRRAAADGTVARI